jgi:hypothetical protein
MQWRAIVRAAVLAAHRCLCLLIVVGSCLRQGVRARHGVVRLQQNWNWQGSTGVGGSGGAGAPFPPAAKVGAAASRPAQAAGAAALALTLRVMRGSERRE